MARDFMPKVNLRIIAAERAASLQRRLAWSEWSSYAFTSPAPLALSISRQRPLHKELFQLS